MQAVINEESLEVMCGAMSFAGEDCRRGARSGLRRHRVPTQVECGRDPHYAQGRYLNGRRDALNMSYLSFINDTGFLMKSVVLLSSDITCESASYLF